MELSPLAPDAGLWSILPPVLAILLALLTKEVVFSLFVGVLAGIGIYAAAGTPALRLLTSDEAVVQACRQFLPWLLLMPPLGCAAFTWDGIYMGATASRGLRDSMAAAAVAFFAVWYAGKWLLHPEGAAAIHLLFAAYFSHLLLRTVLLTARWRREVLSGAR